MLEPHLRRGLREAQGLERIRRMLGLPRVDVAVAARARAGVSEDLKRRRPAAPAFGDVRAAGLLADRVQALPMDEVSHLEVARVRARRAHLHPFRAARPLGDGQRALHLCQCTGDGRSRSSARADRRAALSRRGPGGSSSTHARPRGAIAGRAVACAGFEGEDDAEFSQTRRRGLRSRVPASKCRCTTGRPTRRIFSCCPGTHCSSSRVRSGCSRRGTSSTARPATDHTIVGAGTGPSCDRRNGRPRGLDAAELGRLPGARGGRPPRRERRAAT